MSKQGKSSSNPPTKPLQRDLLHFFSSSSRYVKYIHILTCIVVDSLVAEQVHVATRFSRRFLAIKLLIVL